jgi:hypothetical protein
LQKLASLAADRQQRDFHRTQGFILFLGFAVTTLVVVNAIWDDFAVLATAPDGVRTVLLALIILLPITVTVLTALMGRFRPGTRWLLLRGGSESIKRDIYRYRARAGMYSPAETRTTSREVKLSESVGSTLGGLMRTDVGQLGFGASAEPEIPATKMTALSARGYVDERVSGQIKYYTDTAAKLVWKARAYRVIAIVFGGLGTFLAAVGLQIWVAVSTSVVAIFTTLVESRQLETSATFYNQAAADLMSIRSWWNALPEADRESQATIDRLVERSERILRAEHAGWVQEMQDAMTQFRLEEVSDQGGASAGSTGNMAPGGNRQESPDSPAPAPPRSAGSPPVAS